MPRHVGVDVLEHAPDVVLPLLRQDSENLGILPQQGKDDVGSMFEDVYADVPWHIAEQRDAALSESRD